MPETAFIKIGQIQANFALNFLTASLRRHYPDQVPRVGINLSAGSHLKNPVFEIASYLRP